MIFGKRSERLAVIVAEQLTLELDDLATGVTPPAPANDDTPATKLPASPRKKARRNIGALPKHLPIVLNPGSVAFGVFQWPPAPIGKAFCAFRLLPVRSLCIRPLPIPRKSASTRSTERLATASNTQRWML